LVDHQVIRWNSIDAQHSHHGNELPAVLCAVVEAVQVHLPSWLMMHVPFEIAVAQRGVKLFIVGGSEECSKLRGMEQ
jgi:hypothetical protein